MTSSVDQKKLQTTSQSQTCTKTKVMVWWSATCLTLYSFLNPRETITSEKYAQQIDARINVTTAAGIGQQKVPSSSPRPHPTARCTTNALKVEWIGLWSFASSAIFTWPLMNRLLLLQAFCREKASTISRMQNMLSRMLSNPKSQIFMLNE